MRVEQQEAESELDLHFSRGFINPLAADQYLSNIMDVRAAAKRINGGAPNLSSSSTTTTTTEGIRRIEYRRRSFSQGHGKRIFSASYFGAESMFLLVCLTATLLLLPLILPPLPPPPFMLLLLPICILVVLMVLAFMPSSSNVVRDAATTTTNTNYTYL